MLGEGPEGLEASLSPAGHHNQEPRRGSDVVNGKVTKKSKKKETIFYNFISFGRWVSKVHQTSKSRLYLVCCSMLKFSNAVTLYTKCCFTSWFTGRKLAQVHVVRCGKQEKTFSHLKFFEESGKNSKKFPQKSIGSTWMLEERTRMT